MAASDSLIAAVIRQESRGNPNAVNPNTGASGLMQIMPATAADPGFGVAPLDWGQRFNAEANKRFGSDYLGAMIDRYGGDQARALVAYNWGVGNADKWNGEMSSLPAETQGYVRNILGGEYSAGGAQTYADPAGYQIGQPVPEDALTRAMSAGLPRATEARPTAPVPEQEQPAPQTASAPQPRAASIQRDDALSRALANFKQLQSKRRAG